MHGAMRKAAQVCGFNRPVGEAHAQSNLKKLVARLNRRQHEEVEAHATAQGSGWVAEIKGAKKRVQEAKREVEDEHECIYSRGVAEHERYMERVVPYKSLRYIRELAEAGRPHEMKAVRLPDGRVTGNKREVLAAVAESFRTQHNTGQKGLGETTRKMVRAPPQVFTKEQSRAIHNRRVTLEEMGTAVQALKRKKSPGVDQLVAEAYHNPMR